ncbi:MAG: hypothetical protein VW397_03225 [Candidatus Margulisiibacteriota bacterium]
MYFHSCACSINRLKVMAGVHYYLHNMTNYLHNITNSQFNALYDRAIQNDPSATYMLGVIFLTEGFHSLLPKHETTSEFDGDHFDFSKDDSYEYLNKAYDLISLAAFHGSINAQQHLIVMDQDLTHCYDIYNEWLYFKQD